MARTKEELVERIKKLDAAGIDHSTEDAELKAITGGASVPQADASDAAPEADDFIGCDTETFDTGGGGGWISPETTGIKPAVCRGFIKPGFAEDQIWFIYENEKGAAEEFRGSLVCGALSGEPGKGGAWKVKDILVGMGVPFEVVPGKGVKILKPLDGMKCMVDWEDVTIKGKTERRIQDVVPQAAEQAV